MIAQQYGRIAIRTDDLETLRASYGVPRRRDGNYAAALFVCPATNRLYLSVRPPILHDDAAAPYVSTHCYWCDAYGGVRSEPAFDRDHPQSHGYPVVEAADDRL